MEAPNPKRRHREVSSSIHNPNPLPIAPIPDQTHFDSIISPLLSISEPSPFTIGRFLDRALDTALASASNDVSVQDLILDRTSKLASSLIESIKRCIRKQASVYNFNSWSLPPDLTIKVFSMLDTKSLMQAMACCTMFHKYAMDPLCYPRLELKDRNVDCGLVRTLILRAGKELRSLELGHVADPAKTHSPLHLGNCLFPVSDNDGFIGNCLRRLHLYNLSNMIDDSSLSALLDCPNITDLKIVGLSSEKLFQLLGLYSFRLIEHLYLESFGFPGSYTKYLLWEDIVLSIPNLTSLTLIDFEIDDKIPQVLIEGSRKLKYMNLSRTRIKGRFLRGLEHGFKDSPPLETLILRDCYSLEEKEVLLFLNSITGKERFIRHIDISSSRGLVVADDKRSNIPNLRVEKLIREILNVKIVTDYTKYRRGSSSK